MLINTNGGNGYTLPTNVRTPNVSQGTGFTGTSGNYPNNGFANVMNDALNSSYFGTLANALQALTAGSTNPMPGLVAGGEGLLGEGVRELANNVANQNTGYGSSGGGSYLRKDNIMQIPNNKQYTLNKIRNK